MFYIFAVICICVQALNVNMLSSFSQWNILLDCNSVFPPTFVIQSMFDIVHAAAVARTRRVTS